MYKSPVLTVSNVPVNAPSPDRCKRSHRGAALSGSSTRSTRFLVGAHTRKHTPPPSEKAPTLGRHDRSAPTPLSRRITHSSSRALKCGGTANDLTHRAHQYQSLHDCDLKLFRLD